MSVMLTKFESKSNRVKGTCIPNASSTVQEKLTAKFQVSPFIRRSRFSPPLCIMAAYNCGTTVWVCSLTDSRNTKVHRFA